MLVVMPVLSKRTPLQIRVLAELRADRVCSYAEIARRAGASPGRVRQLALRHGLERRARPVTQPASALAPPVSAATAGAAAAGDSVWAGSGGVFTGPAVADAPKGVRPLPHPVTGAKLPGVTDLFKVMSRKALTRWKVAQVVKEAIRNPPDMTRETPQQAEARMKAAVRGPMHEGFQAHMLIAQGANPDDVPPGLRGYVTAARDYMTARGLTPRLPETTVWSDKYVGSVDMIAEAPNGELVVLDWKTTQKANPSFWPESAVQVAAYARSSLVADSGKVYNAGGRIKSGYVVAVTSSGDWAEAQIDTSEDGMPFQMLTELVKMHDFYRRWHQTDFYPLGLKRS